MNNFVTPPSLLVDVALHRTIIYNIKDTRYSTVLYSTVQYSVCVVFLVLITDTVKRPAANDTQGSCVTVPSDVVRTYA